MSQPSMPATPMLSDKPKNYADTASVRERVKGELSDLLRHVRDRKRSLNLMWQSFFKVWSMEHEQRGYVGRSNLYIPAGRKGVETLTSQLVSGTFPVDDPFNVSSREAVYDEAAPDVKAALDWGISQARVRGRAEAYYRSLLITGNAVTKFGWRKKTLKQRVRGSSKSKYVDSELFVSEPGYVDTEATVYDGPTFDLVDPANFYVWPETAQDLREATVVFEDMSITWRALHAMARCGELNKEQVEALKSGESGSSDHSENEQARLEGQRITQQTAESTPTVVDVTEVWMDMDPTASSWEMEDPDKIVPMLITVSTKSCTVLRVVENPLHHRTPPYGIGRMGVVEGRFWGSGAVESIRDLQVLLNDQTNQSTDCASYHLNPIILANPNILVGDPAEIEPGAIQWMLDINNGMKFDRPPGDLIQTGAQLMAQTGSWIQDHIGAPPVLSGGSAPGRAFRSATGIGTAQRNATVPLQEVVRACEVETWEPMLKQFWFLIQQNASDTMLLQVAGQTKRIDPKELVGDYAFKWWASSQAQNSQVKGTQLTQLLQLLSNPQMQQLMQQGGLKLNVKPLIKKLYEEVFGFRDIDDVLVKEVMQGAGMQPPGQPGMPPDIGGGNGQTLPENALGGNEQTEAGTDGTQGGEFQGNRAVANELAGLLGSSQG